MTKFILPLFTIAVCVVNCTNVVLNLSNPDKNVFSKEPSANLHYNKFILIAKCGYRVVAIIDSGIPIWRPGTSDQLLGTAVFYKSHVVQLVLVRYITSWKSTSLFFKRERGKFVQVDGDSFTKLSLASDLCEKSLCLDLATGFSNHIFDIQKSVVNETTFHEYTLKEDLELLILKNTDQVIVEKEKNQELVKAIVYFTPEKNKMLKIYAKDSDGSIVHFFFERIENVWITKDAKRLLELHSTVPSPAKSPDEQIEPKFEKTLADLTLGDEEASVIAERTFHEADQTTETTLSYEPLYLTQIGRFVDPDADEQSMEIDELAKSILLADISKHSKLDSSVLDKSTTEKPHESDEPQEPEVIEAEIEAEDETLRPSTSELDSVSSVDRSVELDKKIPKTLKLKLHPDLRQVRGFSMLENLYENGIVERVYTPISEDLVKVSNFLMLWEVDVSTEVKCLSVKAYFHEDLIPLVITTVELKTGEQVKRYYDNFSSLPLSKEDFDKKFKDLMDFADKSLTLNLDYISNEHISAEAVVMPYHHPYSKFTPDENYKIGKVIGEDTVIWKSSSKEKVASHISLYYHFQKPAYIVINTINEKTITFDIVSKKRIENLTKAQLNCILKIYPRNFSVFFNFSDPLNHEKYLIFVKEHKGCILRNFLPFNKRLLGVKKDEDLVTPINILPFTKLSVYYYLNKPIYFITSPNIGERYFALISNKWKESSREKFESDLARAREETQVLANLMSSQLSLHFENPTENFLIETWEKFDTNFVKISPLLNHTITTIHCNGIDALPTQTVQYHTALFYIKNVKPYKVELLKPVDSKYMKFVFLVFDVVRSRKRWSIVSEDFFKSFNK